MRRRLRVPVMGCMAGGWILGGFPRAGAGLERLLAGGNGFHSRRAVARPKESRIALPGMHRMRPRVAPCDCQCSSREWQPYREMARHFDTGNHAATSETDALCPLLVLFFMTRASFVLEFGSRRPRLHFIEPCFSYS